MGQKVCPQGAGMVCARRPGESDAGGYSPRSLTRLVKLWTRSIRRERRQHNFALFDRILRSYSSGGPNRPTQVHIIWESSNIDIDQPAFVIYGEGVASYYVVSVGWCRILDGVIPL